MKNTLLIMSGLLFLTSCATKYWVMGSSYPTCYYGKLPPAFTTYDSLSECQNSSEYQRKLNGRKVVISLSASVLEDKYPDEYSCLALQAIDMGIGRAVDDSPTFDNVEDCEKSPELKKYKKQAKADFIQRRTQITDQLIKENKKLAPYKKLITNREIRIGMPTYALLASWGEPERINSSITSGGTDDQYVYGDSYVYVKNGLVRSIQTSR